MIAPATIAQRLEDAALVQFLDAVEATLKPLFPDVTVRQHPGKIDVSDMIEKDIFVPPMIAVSAAHWRLTGDIGGLWDLSIGAVAYIVTEDMAIGSKLVRRQEIAHALAQGLLEVLGDLDAQRWGLRAINSPEKVEARPLFTSETFAKGSAYYVLSWEQTLSDFGTMPLKQQPFDTVTDFDGLPVDDSDGAPL